MHQYERHALIVQQARQATRVEVSALAELLDVTPETVRRDLTQLERKGLVQRVHGGAIAVEKLDFEPTLAARSRRRSAEKRCIAEAALAYLPAAGSIILDAGSTTSAIAELLPTDRELNVLTNSLPIATQISRYPDFSLHLLGGRVRPRTEATTGGWGLRELQEVHVDVAFIGTNGLTVEIGLTTPDQAEAAMKQAMVAAASRVVAVADSTKIGMAHFTRFATLADVDVLITDEGVDPDTANEIRAIGPEVVIA